jgi:hypothetical protein
MDSIVRQNFEEAAPVMAEMKANRRYLESLLDLGPGPDELRPVVDEASGNKLEMMMPMFEAAVSNGDWIPVLDSLDEELSMHRRRIACNAGAREEENLIDTHPATPDEVSISKQAEQSLINLKFARASDPPAGTVPGFKNLENASELEIAEIATRLTL